MSRPRNDIDTDNAEPGLLELCLYAGFICLIATLAFFILTNINR